MTALLMMAILIFGIEGYRTLPVSDLPNIDFPTMQVQANLLRRQPGNHGIFGRRSAGASILHHRRRYEHDVAEHARNVVGHHSVFA